MGIRLTACYEGRWPGRGRPVLVRYKGHCHTMLGLLPWQPMKVRKVF